MNKFFLGTFLMLLPLDMCAQDYQLVWSDEFDGTELDKTKWEYRTHIWGKRHPGFSEDEGLYLDGNSNAVFTIFEKDGDIELGSFYGEKGNTLVLYYYKGKSSIKKRLNLGSKRMY